ncbi:uncharacterized protein FRV6_05276 [Fusarium oxysporum]|uniref:Uncharacterized protein n=1 Tax=Fusarium oxysporum TaxID=5507 RepID=A0A2H3TH19_FUSOX|nr:uncharacterized protein FRV6_05276 [Fusarium oxysporum]
MVQIANSQKQVSWSDISMADAAGMQVPKDLCCLIGECLNKLRLHPAVHIIRQGVQIWTTEGRNQAEMTAVRTINVEVAFVFNEPGIAFVLIVMGQNVVATGYVLLNTRRLFGHQDPESHPTPTRRIARQPYRRSISSTNLVEYTIMTVIVEIAEMNRMVPPIPYMGYSDSICGDWQSSKKTKAVSRSRSGFDKELIFMLSGTEEIRYEVVE